MNTQPAEHCGNISPGPLGYRSECVLRPGHSGSHANETGGRWWPVADNSTDPAAVPENRLRLAHQARRAKEHQLDDIRRALCDIGFMDDNDPYSHADLADVIRQNGNTPADTTVALATDLHEQVRAAIEDEVYEYRERTMFWEETGGVTQEIARLAARGVMRVLQQQTATTHNDGPTVAECAAADRRWPLEKAGE